MRQYEQRQSRQVVVHLSWGLSLRLCHTSSLNKCILRTWELGLGLLAWLYKAKLKVEDGSGKWLFHGLQCASFPWFSLIILSADAAGRVRVNSLLKMRTRSLRTVERGLCEGGACTALVHGGRHGQ